MIGAYRIVSSYSYLNGQHDHDSDSLKSKDRSLYIGYVKK